MGVSPDHTSVPRWPAEPPEIDPSGREYLVFSRGEAARPVAEAWALEVRASGRPVFADHRAADDEAPHTLLATQLACARVGTRVMVAGPELDVLDVIRTARAAGVIDAEIRTHVTDATMRRVYCPHCDARTVTPAAVGDTAPCHGCGRTLIVYHHVSRRHGAYLGYMVDAEEPAA